MVGLNGRLRYKYDTTAEAIQFFEASQTEDARFFLSLLEQGSDGGLYFNFKKKLSDPRARFAYASTRFMSDESEIWEAAEANFGYAIAAMIRKNGTKTVFFDANCENPEAQYYLGRMLQNQSDEKLKEKGLDFWWKAAEKGWIEAAEQFVGSECKIEHSDARIIRAIKCQGVCDLYQESRPEFGSSFLKTMGRVMKLYMEGQRNQLGIVFALGDYFYWTVFDTKLWETNLVAPMQNKGLIAMRVYIRWMQKVRAAIYLCAWAFPPKLSKDVTKMVLELIWETRDDPKWFVDEPWDLH
jgi:TPR repeat protein